MIPSARFRPTYRNIWAVSYPLIVAGISETVVDITDTVFLAHYGVVELGAIALADAIYGVALFMTLGLVDGIQITTGRRAGEGDSRQIGRVFNQGLYLLAITAILLILVIKLAVPTLTAELLVSDAIHQAVDDYLQIAAYALLFHSFNLALSTFYLAIARTRVLIGATLTLAFTNIALDYGLIFGNWGLPELGIEGAAYASLAAEIATSAFLLLDVLHQRYTTRYGLLQFGRWNATLARRLMTISLPVSAETLVETGQWLVFFAIIEKLGEQPLAQANIIYSCYALFLIPLDAFSETVCSMVSNLIGQDKAQRLRPLLRRTIVLAYLVTAPVLLLTLAFPTEVIAIFSEAPQMVEGVLGGLLVAVLVTLVAVPGEMLYSAVTGTGDTRTALLIQVLVTLCTLGFAYVTAIMLRQPLAVVWSAELLGWLVCLGLSWWWLRSGHWRERRV